MRVYSYDEHAEVGDFLPATGHLRVYRRSVAPHRTAPLRGHYSVLNRRLAVLYRDADILKFFLEGFGSIELTGGTVASWQLVSKNKARLAFNTTPAVDVVYRSNFNRVVAHIAAAPDTTREDLDFGLHVSKVLTDDVRRELLYRDQPG